eukprot:TRINITY_DN542_c0_g4_i1.p8 TRINITY_DN542_c0_g4~~TRINITY_DN542_c0_g4_i1.p8  ORF type:complete len:109 (+),score=7.92 TRINITY_DN542_c0_g4_i1:1160-1486(+)
MEPSQNIEQQKKAMLPFLNKYRNQLILLYKLLFQRNNCELPRFLGINPPNSRNAYNTTLTTIQQQKRKKKNGTLTKYRIIKKSNAPLSKQIPQLINFALQIIILKKQL